MGKQNLWSRWSFELTQSCDRAIAWSRRASTAFARPAILIASLAVLAPVCVILIQSALHASGPITVNTLSDAISADGFCSLREAITNANNAAQTYTDCAAGTGSDTIVFSVSGAITLGSSLPAIVNTLTIDGTGQTLTVDGADSYGVLSVNSAATLNLNHLAITNGNATNGGGIYNDGTLTVTDSTFWGNNATYGGGIYNYTSCTLTVTNSTFWDNAAATVGGGIINYGTLTVTNSTFSDNTATTDEGGGIGNIAGTLTVTNSTFVGNTAPYGGGIYNYYSDPPARTPVRRRSPTAPSRATARSTPAVASIMVVQPR